MSKQPVLKGVHHSARPTWKLRETVEFYRDKLGLPLVHAISARGWGPSNHPDFLHFFFDSGNDSTIAFFYYINTEQPDYTQPVADYRFEATHTAWRVDTREELLAWRDRLESQGIPLIFQIRHELIESIYFNDPNGYYLEITIQERPMDALDAEDATRTLEAAMALEDGLEAGRTSFTSIDQVWKAKAKGIDPEGADALALYVLDAPEFSPLVQAAEQAAGVQLERLGNGYWKITAEEALLFERKKLGFVPALWNAALTGGFVGQVSEFDRYRLQISRGEQ
ncbi:VOC family protein [Pseudomonas aeruginosa]|jgi:catechol 2,3-dioxygenase-like lactoylglutathione lyase family enzyme|nr:VOC family protein [Pseudomonas aeruginosa]MCS9139090.1 VOC family protein [Pseudomonas aeruginosa]MCS9211929.1 VOC family protein [Pseudomonas aeruginosa]